MAATRHFVSRVQSRIGAHIDAQVLAEGIVWAIENRRDDLVQFVSRVDRKGLRLFRFTVPPDSRLYYALVDTQNMTCVTVMPPGFRVGRQGKSMLKLKGDDW